MAVRQDIQLKGAGRTPWSRGGDGRAWIGPVLREYVVSEAMAALGVPTTRALAAVTTGETVRRESALPGAVLTRVARSHVRVGTFQYFAARQDIDALDALIAHVVTRNYPELADAESPATGLLDAVLQRQAELVAHWQSIGFIHGVMNTDNCSVSGDTIDYGPCAFMDSFDPQKVFSSIDQMNRYAYGNQPGIAQWNVANLAQCLLPLMHPDKDRALSIAQELVNEYPARFEAAWLWQMRAKLGLQSRDALGEDQHDHDLANDLLSLMADAQADFTQTFRALSHLPSNEPSKTSSHSGLEMSSREGTASVQSADGSAMSTGTGEPLHDDRFTELFTDPTGVTDWLQRWRKRHVAECDPVDSRRHLMQSTNPALIPRNHQVEAVIQAAVDGADFEPFHALVEATAEPFAETTANAVYRRPPLPTEVVRHTFCGT